MRIGIDGSSILPRRTGIGHYTSQLLRGLARVDADNEYVVFLNSLRHRPPREPWRDRRPFAASAHRVPGPALLLAWRWLDWPPIERFVGAVDLFHSPATYIPPQRRGAHVTTVHDLYFLRDPESCELLGGRYLRATLPRRLNELDRIIAVSHSTRRDLIEMLGAPAEKIAVVYEGVEERFRRIEDPAARAAFRARHNLPERYLLFVGTLEPRKNVARLIEAYSLVCAERPEAPPLVIVGGRGLGAERVEQAVTSFGLGRRVVLAGYVDHAELPTLYCGAELFVLPSLYEGFGLPVLEAMACGVAVVAGDTSSLRELVAGRGVLVNPMRPSEIAAGILRALEDAGLRADCTRRGLDFARELTWERCARETLAVYEDAVRARA